MDQTSTQTSKPVKKVKKYVAQPSDSTITFLMNFARLYVPFTENSSSVLLN